MIFGWEEHGSIHRVDGESLNGSGRSTDERTGWIDDREGSAQRGGPARALDASGSSDESQFSIGTSPKAVIVLTAQINVIDGVQGLPARGGQLEAAVGERPCCLHCLVEREQHGG